MSIQHEDPKRSQVTLYDFHPFSEWELDYEGGRWKGTTIPAYIIDQHTKRAYWHEPPDIIRSKCFLLTLGTSILHPIASIAMIAFRMLKLVSLYHFWRPNDILETYSLKNRAIQAGGDFLKVIITPLTIVGLQLSAIYGIFCPYNGRKLYATLERFQYERSVIAPCFQPDPTHHFFGSDPSKMGGW